MSNLDTCPISLTVASDPHLARLVRMTAANVAMLSSMSVDRVEDIRMAAEEAFIYACSVTPESGVQIDFSVDAEHVAMTFALDGSKAVEPDDQAAAYAELILASVCDSYEKTESPLALNLVLKADV